MSTYNICLFLLLVPYLHNSDSTLMDNTNPAKKGVPFLTKKTFAARVGWLLLDLPPSRCTRQQSGGPAYRLPGGRGRGRPEATAAPRTGGQPTAGAHVAQKKELSWWVSSISGVHKEHESHPQKVFERRSR